VYSVAKELEPIDISGLPELIRIAEEVCETGAPRLLTRDGDSLAVLVPASTRPSRRAKRARSRADHEAFLSSAGGWRGLVDTDQLKHDIDESRRISSRPPVRV
jgi:hypothetical protein